ncbi:hypothetical protein HNP84_002496 [Thermocatellispora tengchongensis]|uniref:Ricin B lectin domain-containing protein n=1 Tax=Thermocatellispora tengchongensis TaxID=1073253 RepID=A0A840P9V1_9ACTN|nr:RICIN domain-containing protein [Thermocatellispora tengchongensis]MBB5132775.1 hypothetical protein [Thermocatellispora tengchongensis]
MPPAGRPRTGGPRWTGTGDPFTLRPLHTGDTKCLDVAWRSHDWGANVIQADCASSNNANQIWRLRLVDTAWEE